MKDDGKDDPDFPARPPKRQSCRAFSVVGQFGKILTLWKQIIGHYDKDSNDASGPLTTASNTLSGSLNIKSATKSLQDKKILSPGRLFVLVLREDSDTVHSTESEEEQVRVIRLAAARQTLQQVSAFRSGSYCTIPP
jgi:hypothetical protein